MTIPLILLLFFFNDTATTEIYTLSLHDALPIYLPMEWRAPVSQKLEEALIQIARVSLFLQLDRKSTRLNSSHITISYAVFCLKKKKKITINDNIKINLTITLQQLKVQE